MKRTALLAHLTANGCSLAREGGSHSIWKNDKTGDIQGVSDFLCKFHFSVSAFQYFSVLAF